MFFFRDIRPEDMGSFTVLIPTETDKGHEEEDMMQVDAVLLFVLAGKGRPGREWRLLGGTISLLW